MNKVLNYILVGLVFLFPLFFLPTTQEYYATNKFYLLGFGVLVLILLSALNLLIEKKISWKKSTLDTSVLLLLVSVALSAIITSPNKIAALLNQNFGLVTVFSLTILYFFITQLNHKVKNDWYLKALEYSGLLLAVLAVFSFLQPFKNIDLPATLLFLKSPYFSPIGARVDLSLFLGLIIALKLPNVVYKRERVDGASLASLVVLFVSLVLCVYSILKPLQPDLTFVFAPFRVSWYAALEILKNPTTAFFGVGLDNYSSIFTQAKDALYNQSNLWQISSFNSSHSAVLHIFSVAGLFGILSFAILVFLGYKTVLGQPDSLEKQTLLFGFSYLVLAFVFFPLSLVTLFLFFVLLGLIGKHYVDHSHAEPAYLSLSALLPAYILIVLLALVFVGGSGYFLGKAYLSEYTFKKSLDAFNQRNGFAFYNNQKNAVLLNPYNESFRISFSQANLLIANNVAIRAREAQKGKSQVTLSEQDRQTIAQAVQAAIQEAKSAVILNPQKSFGWENLANIYRSIIGVAQGADVWTVSSYQRAIVLDPRNPNYYLGLGGVYYSLGNYSQSSQLFQQAALLKPDWANAHYNLAWSLYQQQNYRQAAVEMQTVLGLIDKNKNPKDYELAKKNLEDFKKKIPAEEQQKNNQGQLQVPQPSPEVSPKIELPQNAQPPKTASPTAQPKAK